MIRTLFLRASGFLRRRMTTQVEDDGRRRLCLQRGAAAHRVSGLPSHARRSPRDGGGDRYGLEPAPLARAGPAGGGTAGDLRTAHDAGALLGRSAVLGGALAKAHGATMGRSVAPAITANAESHQRPWATKRCFRKSTDSAARSPPRLRLARPGAPSPFVGRSSGHPAAPRRPIMPPALPSGAKKPHSMNNAPSDLAAAISVARQRPCLSAVRCRAARARYSP